MTVATRLEQAIGTGEIITIRYHGGSQPGTHREIVPLRIEGDYVRAHCLSSKATKQFSLDKVELVDRQAAQNEWRTPSTAPKSIDDIQSSVAEIIQAQRWHLTRESTEDGEWLHLHSAFKNGKIRKTPDIGISLQPMTHDSVVNQSGEIMKENIRPRVRPWSVYSKNFAAAKTFTHAETALAVFIQQAHLLSPNEGDTSAKEQ